jgi:DNA-directed RNA polymerase specialized sigma subunit
MNTMTAAARETLCTPARATAAPEAASLAAAIQELHGMQRLVVTLYYVEGLRLPEIALVLELSELEVAHFYTQAITALGGSAPAHRQAA